MTLTSDLLREQARVVDQKLREILSARGVDPDDRSPGWEWRCRKALADLEIRERFERTGDFSMRIITTISPGPRSR